MTNVYIFPFASQKEDIRQHILMLPVQSGYVTLYGWNADEQLIYYNSKSIAYGNFDDIIKFCMDMDINGFHHMFLYADTQEDLEALVDYATFGRENCHIRKNITNLKTPEVYHGFMLSK